MNCIIPPDWWLRQHGRMVRTKARTRDVERRKKARWREKQKAKEAVA